MYTLKEVCQMLDMTEHTLRYYTDIEVIPNVKRDKNNHRIFDDQAIEWLRGTKYLRGLGMSIEAIKEYHKLCQEDGDEAVKQRYQIILAQQKIAEKELEYAKQRLAFIQKKAANELAIINHDITDFKNPSRIKKGKA